MNIALAITSGLTGAVIAVESLGLFVGVRLFAKSDELWLCIKNDLLVLLDVAAGATLIYFAFIFQKMPPGYLPIVGSGCGNGEKTSCFHQDASC